MPKKHNPSKTATQKRKADRRKGLPWVWIGLGIALLAVIAFVLFWWKPWQAASTPADISVQQAYQKFQQKVFLLDVRTQEEWNQVHVPGAVLIPLTELESRLSELPRDREIMVMCHSGNRSKQGRDLLLKAGFTRVSSVTGGIAQWQAAGYPVQEAAP